MEPKVWLFGCVCVCRWLTSYVFGLGWWLGDLLVGGWLQGFCCLTSYPPLSPRDSPDVSRPAVGERILRHDSASLREAESGGVVGMRLLGCYGVSGFCFSQRLPGFRRRRRRVCNFLARVGMDSWKLKARSKRCAGGLRRLLGWASRLAPSGRPRFFGGEGGLPENVNRFWLRFQGPPMQCNVHRLRQPSIFSLRPHATQGLRRSRQALLSLRAQKAMLHKVAHA